MRAFAYERPNALADVCSLLGRHGPAARVLAGGTDLLVGIRHGAIRPALVVDLKRVTELQPTITTSPDAVTVGATVTLADLVANDDVNRLYPALVEAAVTVGSIQIRHRATLAGNVCNASPAADTAPALLIYGAAIEIAGRSGTRRVQIADFVLGPRQTALEPDEVVIAIRIPRPDPSTGAANHRLTRRRGVDLATVSVCCAVDGSGVTRFAYSAVGPRPFLVTDTTGALADPQVSEAERALIIATITAQASPITDVRATREYRQAMLDVLSHRALKRALRRRSA
jgi:CO/xanthine dehydrogenase FAD-binding subunit